MKRIFYACLNMQPQYAAVPLILAFCMIFHVLFMCDSLKKGRAVVWMKLRVSKTNLFSGSTGPKPQGGAGTAGLRALDRRNPEPGSSNNLG